VDLTCLMLYFTLFSDFSHTFSSIYYVAGTGIMSVIHCRCVYRDDSVITESQPPRRTDSIKTFIRNIGLPAPPVIGRKISAPPTAPISMSTASVSTGVTVGTLPTIPSSPARQSADTASSGTSSATPKHSVS